MKALTIRQPWASMIGAGWKDVENRTWKTNYRGPLLIHAGKTRAEDTLLLRSIFFLCFDNPPEELLKKLPRGGIVGQADLVDCVRDHPSTWAEPGMWHWVFVNAKTLPFHPCLGRQGLWNFKG